MYIQSQKMGGNKMSKLGYICFDIETIPDIINIKNTWKNEYILSKTENKKGENRGNIERFASLDPNFGRVVSIALYSSITDEYTILKWNPLVVSGDEDKILSDFWQYRRKHAFDKLVSFNGKQFDCFYITSRSAILGINNDGLRLQTKKYDTSFHFDVFEILTNFNSWSNAHSLDTFCKIYGIPYDDTANGSDVYKLFLSGELEKIYAHNLSDVKATKELYERIKDYF